MLFCSIYGYSYVWCYLTAILVLGLVIRGMSGGGPLESVDFEVSGRVQGVFFRKYTEEKADALSLKGCVKNTRSGTVAGTVQGSAENMKIMMNWLRQEGSPMSRIDNCEFKNHRQIKNYEYRKFAISHS